MIEPAEIFERARCAHRQGCLDEAARLYREILASGTESHDATHYLGVIATQQGRPAEALPLIASALRALPNRADIHVSLGNAHKALGDYTAAEESYRKAIAINPDYSPGWGNLGVALRMQNRNEEAAACFERVVALKPDNIRALTNLGAAQQAAGRLEEALSSLRRAIEKAPDYADAHNNLGIALQQSGDQSAALAAFTRAVSLAPVFPQAYNNMGNTLMALRRPLEGISAYEKAVEQNPNDIRAWNSLGEAQSSQGRLATAADAFDEGPRFKAREPKGDDRTWPGPMGSRRRQGSAVALDPHPGALSGPFRCLL